LFAHSLLALLQAQVPGTSEHRITNIFRPFATPAKAEKDIAYLVFAITGVIFVAVTTLIVYAIWRFRLRPGDDARQEPPQVYGSTQIEAAWTVIPILIVFVLIGVTARVVASVQNASPPSSMVKLRVIGHQWWWEVHYPDYGIVTANEVHMPATPDGKMASYLELQSVDVLHNFWVPQLAGKIDLIPNRTNYMWMDPREPGIYVGNCAEYCGTQHANMLLRVIAQTPEDFRQWASEQQKTAAAGALANPGRKTFESLACVNCHVVKGTAAAGKFGPDLTHLMSRQTLASAMLPNTSENLRAWVDDPQKSKPGCLMPSMKLSDDQLNAVTSYLEALR
jgi:cytochrome c oxidase subunit II